MHACCLFRCIIFWILYFRAHINSQLISVTEFFGLNRLSRILFGIKTFQNSYGTPGFTAR